MCAFSLNNVYSMYFNTFVMLYNFNYEDMTIKGKPFCVYSLYYAPIKLFSREQEPRIFVATIGRTSS